MVSRPLRVAVAAAFLCVALALPADVRTANAQSAPPPQGEVARLVWSTLLALDHANRTGNYTVLRDLAADGFRAINDAARLAAIFAPTRDLPLGQVVLHTPEFFAPPEIGADGLLRLNGRIPMRPEAVLFEMLFTQGGTDWRLFGLSVAPEPRTPEEDDEAGQ